MTKEYEFLEHTADAKFIAYGKNLEEAFKHVAEAIKEILMGQQKIKKEITKKFSLESNDIKSLVHDFMDNLIYLLDTENFVLSKVKSIKVTKKDKWYNLDAEFIGDLAKKYKFETTIKAATYAEMEIKEAKNKVSIQAVVDL